MAAPTVVSAYYPIPSKFKPDKYLEWIMAFWPKISCPLIFFTDPAIAPKFEELLRGRGPTAVIGLPFHELSAFQKLSPMAWAEAHLIDHERDKHSPELYAIWYEKKEFVARAIEMNPFGSDHFVWCDAGICRFPEWIPQLQAFPRREAIPTGAVLALRISPFDQPMCADGIRGDFTLGSSVGGGILAADKTGWKLWSKAYDEMLLRFCLAGRFIGKDQNIMGSMILERPELALIVDPPAAMSSIQRWFYLLFYLSGVHVV
jgi:hypothetical protein